MRVRAIHRVELLALLAVSLGAAELEPRVFVVLEEYDRLSARPLWPGFEPRQIPLEIYDAGRTWLFRHPAPPPEFVRVAGRKRMHVFEGRHSSVRANTSIEIAGVAVASAAFEGRSEVPRQLAGLLLHEAFHVFQAQRHPNWGGNEADLFLYPTEDPEALALRRLESAALTRAVAAIDRKEATGWAAAALALRRERFARLPAAAVAYERGTEMKEGLARFIEAKTAGLERPLFSEKEFVATAIRDRSYASGCAIALLLERLLPGWKDHLEKEQNAPLDELLAWVLKGVAPNETPAAEIEQLRRRAQEDVAAVASRRAALRREFLETPGWKVIVEAERSIWPQGFDPSNAERLSSSEILHTRWVKLGNEDGSLEVLDHRCLTEAAGKHPLFEGVRRATVTGLASEPRVEDAEGAVKISIDGLQLNFRGARLSRSDQTLTLSVRGKN